MEEELILTLPQDYCLHYHFFSGQVISLEVKTRNSTFMCSLGLPQSGMSLLNMFSLVQGTPTFNGLRPKQQYLEHIYHGSYERSVGTRYSINPVYYSCHLEGLKLPKGQRGLGQLIAVTHTQLLIPGTFYEFQVSHQLLIKANEVPVCF